MSIVPALVLVAAEQPNWSTSAAEKSPIAWSQGAPTTASSSSVALVQDAAAALARGEPAALTSLLHANAQWSAKPGPDRTGAHATVLDQRGAQAYVSRLAGAIRGGSQHLQILSVAAQGSDVMVQSTWGRGVVCRTLVRILDGTIIAIVEQPA